MRNILLLIIIAICFFLIQSCKFEKSGNLQEVKITGKIEKQEMFEVINNRLNTTENCLICDSTHIFKSVEDFLQMERFNGKVVYLDFWGTGCKPCLEEFAYMPDLKKKFQDESIEYLYISTYQGKEWDTYQEMLVKMLIKKHNLTGINLLVSKDSKYRFYDNYKDIVDPRWGLVVPTYLLFNKKGEVIDFNAPRPSSKEVLYEKIQKLLDE